MKYTIRALPKRLLSDYRIEEWEVEYKECVCNWLTSRHNKERNHMRHLCYLLMMPASPERRHQIRMFVRDVLENLED